MSLKERYEKHKNFIRERWQPIDIKVLLQEDPEKKISIIKAAQKKAVKEIQDQDELHAFIEFLDGQISWNQTALDQNGSANAQGPVQRNETLNTGESYSRGEPVEKIDWEAGLAELTFMFEILFKNEEIGCSMKQYKKRWALIAKHFTVKGEEITSKGLRQAFNQLKINKDEGMPANHEIYKTLLTMVQEIED
tara:strand:- start:963 stop:1541 length:579 start_codon:yes stop_codon:yes gene_type:complete